MMTLVVVYLYTVIAFNFFRKFYVEEAEEEGEEPDRKCHNMFTVCKTNATVFHFIGSSRIDYNIGSNIVIN